MSLAAPAIPRVITVHLGRPDADAANVTVPFSDYVKNVASSEIYPTWPENALRANIYAQISFALNRVYTEYYRSRGYPFDITNSTAYDQYFVNGRDIFENISRIVDGIFNSYLTKGNGIEPYFAQYCNGTTTTCGGLSQWGSVTLARQGYLPYQILRYYYGDDLNIVSNVRIKNIPQSYEGTPLRIGSVGNAVKNIELRLNRISQNYPNIPKIYPPDGIFTRETENAVKEFQSTFHLTQDGIVGPATWYAVQRIFYTVKRLNELNSEGLRLEDISTQFPSVLSFGQNNVGVRTLQYFLNLVGTYVDTVPPLPVTGYFGEQTRNAVLAFQRTYGLVQDGIVGVNTWNRLYDVYRGIVNSIPPGAYDGVDAPFPGTFLVRGSSGNNVRLIQRSLAVIARVWNEVPTVSETGYFGDQTYASVTAFQKLFGIEPNGVVGPVTWDAILSEASDILGGAVRSAGQYAGNYSENAE